MRQAIFAYIDSGGDGLDPRVKEAIQSLRGKGSLQDPTKQTSFHGT